MKWRSEAENLLLMHTNVITTLPRYVCSANYIVCMLFYWCKIKIYVHLWFLLGQHKTGKQKGEFKRKEKIGHHEKKNKYYRWSSSQEQGGFVFKKWHWYAFWSDITFFLGKMGNYALVLHCGIWPIYWFS